jgi:dienelactone hydrolase
MATAGPGPAPAGPARPPPAPATPPSTSTSTPLITLPFAFSSSAGHSLAGTLTQPAHHPPGPPRYALLLHGLNSHRDDAILPALVAALAAAGVASLRFDAVGCGASGGPFSFANYEEEARDAVAAVRALEGVGGVGGRVVAIVGHSKAGTVAVLAGGAAAIPVVVNVSGRFDLSTGLEARFGPDLDARLAEGEGGIPVTWPRGGRGGPPFTWRLTPADLAARRGPAAVDVGAACARLQAGTCCLNVHGADDATIPPTEADRYARASAHCRVVETALIAGGDHNFTDPAAAGEAVAVITAFIARHAPQQSV